MKNEKQLIMISANFCGYCTYIRPHAETICDDKDITFIPLDVHNLPKTIEEPDAFPTFLFRVNKEIVEKWAGSNIDKLKEKIQINFGNK